MHVRTKLRRADSPSEVYAKFARAMPPDVLIAFGAGIARELRQERHTWQAVMEWHADLVNELDRPVLLNIPDLEGSETLVLAPQSWTPERLAGYIAGRHEELEEAFGTVGRVYDPRKEDTACGCPL